MLSYEALSESLSSSDATAQIGVLLMRTAEDISEGEFDPLVVQFVADAGGDESVGDPGALCLLQRAIRANDLYTAGLKDLRAAILKRTVATPSARRGT